MPKFPYNNPVRRGFIFTELLVVVAVASLLLVMALEGFSRLSLSRCLPGPNTLVASANGKSLVFHTQVRNVDPSSRLSLITCYMEGSKLLRTIRPVDWAEELGPPTVSELGRKLLAAEVFGLQFSSFQRDGKVYPNLEQNAALNIVHLPGGDSVGSSQTSLRLWDAIVLSQQTGGLESAITAACLLL